eukprot:jgi/Ulvmu1/12124/UM084_0051.1
MSHCTRPGILSHAFGRSEYHVCLHGHLCDVPGRPNAVKELYRKVLRSPPPAGLSDQDTADALVTDMREQSMLLVLVGLEHVACFAEHGMLRSLVENPGRSKLFVTTSTTALCDALAPIHCQVHHLTAADNEENVMHALMLRLARGSDGLAGGEQEPLEPGSALQVAVDSCVRQCQGNPQLLHLVNDYIRSPLAQTHDGNIRDPNTLQPQHLQQWQLCAGNFFIAMDFAAPDAAGTEARIRHSYLQLVLRALEHAPHAPDAQHAADMPAYQLALCVARAVLRVIAHADALEAWSWYRWSEVVAAAINCGELDWVPHVAEPAFGDRFSTEQWMVFMQAQKIMVNNGLF